MSKKVLIVEDNELNLKLFRDLLEAHGYETLQTKDGMEVMQLARRGIDTPAGEFTAGGVQGDGLDLGAADINTDAHRPAP